MQKTSKYFELALYVICGISIILFAIKGVYSKCFQAALIITVLLLFRGLIAWTKWDFPPALRFSILIFIAITMMFANLFGMYGVIPYLDKIEHLGSGVILFYVGQFVLKKILRRKKVKSLPANIMIWFSLYFSIAMAGVWEIYEFTVDHLFGLTAQNGSLSDTMLDIICGAIAAIGTAIYMFYKVRKNQKLVENVDEA